MWWGGSRLPYHPRLVQRGCWRCCCWRAAARWRRLYAPRTTLPSRESALEVCSLSQRGIVPLLVMFSTMMALGRMVWQWHTWSRLSRSIALVAGVASLLYLLFMLGLAITVQRIRITDPMMLGFGLPASASLLLVLPLIASTCSIALVGLVVWLWLKRVGTVRTRLFYTVSTVTLVGHTFMLASLHLLLPALTNL